LLDGILLGFHELLALDILGVDTLLDLPLQRLLFVLGVLLFSLQLVLLLLDRVELLFVVDRDFHFVVFVLD